MQQQCKLRKLATAMQTRGIGYSNADKWNWLQKCRQGELATTIQTKGIGYSNADLGNWLQQCWL